MPRRPNSVHTYRLHKQSGQAVVTLRDAAGRRRDLLLGRYGSTESKTEYARVIAEWQAAGGHLAAVVGHHADLTVNELLLAFWRHADRHYRHPDGTPTSERKEYLYSLRPVRELYGQTLARDFRPLALKAVRQHMVASGLCRGVVNQRVGRIKRVFKWAVGEELVESQVYAALKVVAGLPAGRGLAPEAPPVQPVPDDIVDATLPFVLPPVRAMVELQRFTGMRPGEACRLRACDVDMGGPVWLYRPPQHKLAWRGKGRVIVLGPQAQAVIRPFIDAAAGEDYLFSPARALGAWRAERRRCRKTPVQPSQQYRRVEAPKRRPGAVYTPHAYSTAIAAACRRARVLHWHPNQLRHNHATMIRRRYGLEAAQVVLGHSRADVTQVYAERDLSLAQRIAAEIG
jgi:integrase